MCLTESGMMIVVSDVVLKKELLPITVTEFGILIVFSDVQLKKASSWIAVVVFGMLTCPFASGDIIHWESIFWQSIFWLPMIAATAYASHRIQTFVHRHCMWAPIVWFLSKTLIYSFIVRWQTILSQLEHTVLNTSLQGIKIPRVDCPILYILEGQMEGLPYNFVFFSEGDCRCADRRHWVLNRIIQ